MFVPLSDSELDTLLTLAVNAGDDKLVSKLSRARVLSPLVGNGALDPDSQAAKHLLRGTQPAAAAPAPAPATAASSASVSADTFYTRAELDKLREKWPVGEARVLNAPLGWLHDGEKLIPNNAEQLAIALALRCRSDGFGFAQIASDLNGRRLRRRNGTKWNSTSVRAMLVNSALHPQNAALYETFGPSS